MKEVGETIPDPQLLLGYGERWMRSQISYTTGRFVASNNLQFKTFFSSIQFGAEKVGSGHLTSACTGWKLELLIHHLKEERKEGRGNRKYIAHDSGYPNSPPGQCLMAILHLLDSAMVGHGIVSFAGFLTICRVLVSRPHLNPHVRLFLLQVPHSLQ